VRVSGRDGVGAGGDLTGNAIGAGSIAVRVDNFVLKAGAVNPPVGFGALPPALPTGSTPRPEVCAKVVDLLVADGPRRVVVLEGGAGSGKTTLAAQVCQDDRLRLRVSSRILWLTLGQSRTGASLAEYIGDVCEAVGGHRPATSDPLLAGAVLGELLAEAGQSVLVVDDVWDREQALPFLQGTGGSPRLFTTRNRAVVPVGESIEVGPMVAHEAADALWAGLSPQDSDDAAALLKFAAGWPLVIGLINATMRIFVQAGGRVDEVTSWTLRTLKSEGTSSIAHDQVGSLERAVETSLSLLEPQQRERYLELGIFRDDAVVPASIAMRLWTQSAGLSSAEAGALITKVADLRLVELSWQDREPCFKLHDVLRNYLRECLGPSGLVRVNRGLVEAWRRELPTERAMTAWWKLSTDSSFIVEHLLVHLLGARLELEYEALVIELRWIELQVQALGSALPAVAALEASSAKVAQVLRRSLVDSLQVLVPEDPQALTATLLSRIGNEPELEGLVERRLQAATFPMLTPHWTLPDRNFLEHVEHTGPIGDIAVSDDGVHLATASDDGLIIIWDAVTVRPLRALRGHRRRARSCSFSPDSRHLVSTGMDGTVRLWRVEDGSLVRAMGDRRSRVLCACWSHDGTTVASVDTLGRVTVWDPWEGEVRRSYVSSSGYEWGCAFAPDDSCLVSCGEDGCLRFWGADGPNPLRTLTLQSARIRCCTFNRQGTQMAAAGNDGHLTVIDVSSGRVTHRLEGHEGRVRWCAFSACGRYLVSAGEDRTARVWDARIGEKQHLLSGHSDWVGGCAFDPSGAFVYTSGGDATVRRWSTTTGKLEFSYAGEISPAECCSATADQQSVLAGYADGTIAQMRAADGVTIGSWPAHEGRVFGVQDTGHGYLSVGGDGKVRQWSSLGRKLRDLDEPGGRLWACACKGDSYASVSESGAAAVYEARTGELRRIAGAHAGSALGCQLSPNGDVLATAGDDGAVRLWATESLEPIGQLTADEDVAFWVCDFSPDGKYVVAAGEPDGVMCVWKVADEERIYTVHAGRGRVSGCAIAPFGSMIATCGEDGYLGLWRLRDGSAITGVRVAAPLRRLSWVSHGQSWLLAAAGSAGVYVFRLREADMDSL
jgi:WD40 repeat protein